MPDSPKGLITTLGQNENFYLRTKDKFFENVSPDSKTPIDSEDKERRS